jgi:hypothetical protein
MLAILFVGVSWLTVLVLFGVVMSIGLVVEFSMVYLLESRRGTTNA